MYVNDKTIYEDHEVIITEFARQNDSYLAEILFEIGYVAHGVTRCISSPNIGCVDTLCQGLYIKNKNTNLDYDEITGFREHIRVNREFSSSKLYSLIWNYKVELEEGIEKLFFWYISCRK